MRIYKQYLHPHVPAVLLQLFLHFLSSQSGGIQHQMLPLNWLEDVGVVRHIQADLYLREEQNLLKHPFSLSPSLHPSRPLLPSLKCAGISCKNSQIRPPALPACGESGVCPSGPAGGSYQVIHSGRCSRRPEPHGENSDPKTGS